MSRIEGRKIGILGMARSGLAAAHLAQLRGGMPFVSDAARPEKVAAAIAELKANGIPYESGEHSDKLLSMDFLVLSPGVPLSLPILVEARKRGLPIFSELEFGWWETRGTVIAITGTNGKTTTTTLVGEICKASGRQTFVGGNIGLPLSSFAAETTDQSVVVLEVSSFQLSVIADFHPKIAAILNFSPDHLEYHGGYAGYRQAKYRITENQTAADTFILNADDKETLADSPKSAAQVQKFSTQPHTAAEAVVRSGHLGFLVNGNFQPICPTDAIRIPGEHNLQNAAAAALIVRAAGVDTNSIASTLSSFAGVEHRIEFVATIDGVEYINDSKATNVDSVIYALRAMKKPTILIAGGRDKGAPYAPLIEAGRSKIERIIAIGEARFRIFDELGKNFPTQFANSLDEAVATAHSLATSGMAVLLSPACSSFDMFENYEERGAKYKQAVMRLVRPSYSEGNHETVR